ncbi:uncharacterized protein BDW43DRAFT_308440 [Aspergillus alliaceus]|uniref:uncharacterized protein n=1 Tax=Petromyces alliaceus TaxID=209559 RepID=UPI0012A73B8F|nr:uncharacterized protein BDW43DRAFT_308440 [Aspergillus alliaceus]KAB8236173.1 hypothetical protein BDW43DRAFT_308440 [Aspergillus alliaceus]
MSCTFAEAWALLLSDPEVENTSYATERGTVNTQPSPTTSISSSSNEFSTLMSTARDPVLQHDLFDSASAARQCLTNLREQLQMLQHTSTLLDNETDTQRIIQLNSSIDMLTQAIPRSRLESASRSQERRPEYRCWDACCGGRLFSNRSNLIRHQREQSGENDRLRCSFCNSRFSRASVRNAHEAKGACRMRRMDSRRQRERERP